MLQSELSLVDEMSLSDSGLYKLSLTVNFYYQAEAAISDALYNV